jgi:hypothetical protein
MIREIAILSSLNNDAKIPYTRPSPAPLVREWRRKALLSGISCRIEDHRRYPRSQGPDHKLKGRVKEERH